MYEAWTTPPSTFGLPSGLGQRRPPPALLQERRPQFSHFASPVLIRVASERRSKRPFHTLNESPERAPGGGSVGPLCYAFPG